MIRQDAAAERHRVGGVDVFEAVDKEFKERESLDALLCLVQESGCPAASKREADFGLGKTQLRRRGRRMAGSQSRSSLSELRTTDNELAAMASAAYWGRRRIPKRGNNAPAATGIRIRL